MFIAFKEKSFLKNSLLRVRKFVNKAKEKWKGKVRLDKTRKLILMNKWNQTIEKLKKQYSSKGKRSTVKKLEDISASKTKEILNNYYSTMKKKLYKHLTKLMKDAKRNEMDATIPYGRFKYVPDPEILDRKSVV